jgi:hypothetical protein
LVARSTLGEVIYYLNSTLGLSTLGHLGDMSIPSVTPPRLYPRSCYNRSNNEKFLSIFIFPSLGYGLGYDFRGVAKDVEI